MFSILRRASAKSTLFAIFIRITLCFFPFLTCAQVTLLQASTIADPCPRYSAGSVLVEPKDIFSDHGILRVTLTYKTRLDSSGNLLYCFTSEDGAQSPTLHVRPGDELLITLNNDLPASMNSMHTMEKMPVSPGLPDLTIGKASSLQCGTMVMTATSVNIHYHGTNTAPVCHQDEVIKTLINSGQSFDYDVHFPLDEPPGLYWYHPHVHGISEAAVQGGASGAIIVEGMQNVIREVARLPQRLLIVRDNPVPADAGPPNDPAANPVPAWDLSVNYTPVAFPQYMPVVVPVLPHQKEFWRVLNASADTILDLQLQYDGVVQPLGVVAIDGVPIGSQDGRYGGQPVMRNHIVLPPGGRAEFIISAPGREVKSAQLLTLNMDTGPDGDTDPQRPLVMIVPGKGAPGDRRLVPAVSGVPETPPRFADLRSETPTAQRKLYFSEVLSDPTDPNSPTNFYITVDGQAPVLFSPDNPPAIVTTQGAVEDWTLENRALENHEFHMHQIHFLVLEQDGRPVSAEYHDTINVPYWSGSGPYPSVKLRMDFRGNVVGDFVYHCHILGHEDAGMMAIIRVLPRR